MSRVLREKNTGRQCFSTIELDTGEKVMISVASGEVKIVRMKWRGAFPGETVWTSSDADQLAGLFFHPNRANELPLESIRNRLLQCSSIAEIRTTLGAH
ncbi:MAG: hypothetical protein ACREK5_10575 [Gemmatimonadota bacterium]